MVCCKKKNNEFSRTRFLMMTIKLTLTWLVKPLFYFFLKRLYTIKPNRKNPPVQTQSSKYFSIAFPPTLLAEMQRFAQREHSTVPFLVRKLCIEGLEKRGIDVSNIQNPPNRGARSDLAKLPSIPESPHRRAKKQKGIV